MATLTVVNHITLDGVMQAPARADEDPRDGFLYGGWASAGNDPVIAQTMFEGMSGSAQLLFGRRTYEDFCSVWPARTEQAFTEVLNKIPKYVASRTLEEPLAWSRSILLRGQAPESVSMLKQTLAGGITILGSGELVSALAAADLIDRWLLLIHPLVLGCGRRLFRSGTNTQLRLIDSVATPTGVLIATYEQQRS